MSCQFRFDIVVKVVLNGGPFMSIPICPSCRH